MNPRTHRSGARRRAPASRAPVPAGALLAALVLAAPLHAQIINVPKPSETGRPVAVAVSAGFLQSQNRVDGQSRTVWFLGEAVQYRASVEVGLRSGSLGLAATTATLPIQRSGGTLPGGSDGDIDLRQYLATFRTRETEGAHQILDLGVGMAQWTNYRGTDALTPEEAKARNAFALVVGYGFGFTIGERASLMLVQEFASLWGSGEGLQAGESRLVRQYTTRLGFRYRFVGAR